MRRSWIKSLYLKDFRNYKQAFVTFNPKVNCLYGANAQGKTNLLEAIHLLVTGRSFRTPHLKELIRFGAPAFHLKAEFEKNGVSQTLSLSYDGQTRRLLHNHTLLPKMSALLGLLTGVVFSPEDRQLIKGGPLFRREFLDIQNAIASPLYLTHLTRYKRALKQRNTLLKEKKTHTIQVWEAQMAASAAYLTRARQESLKLLAKLAAPLQQDLSGKAEELSLKYASKALASLKNPDMLEQYYVEKWQENREKELILGQTLVGPHKDDMIVALNEKEARHFGSEGQLRSTISALRLASVWHLFHITEVMPLVCVDDISISLDNKRLSYLTAHLGQLGQVFITTPDSQIPMEQMHLLEVVSGEVLPPHLATDPSLQTA